MRAVTLGTCEMWSLQGYDGKRKANVGTRSIYKTTSRYFILRILATG
jgi:hypothetical protein